MAFSRYNKDRPFLLVTRYRKPSENEKTNSKNWSETGKWMVQEYVEMVDRVNNRHMRDVTVIIDVLQRRLVKSSINDGTPDDVVVKEYLKRYNQQVVDGLGAWIEQNQRKNAPESIKMVEIASEELEKVKVTVSNGA